MASRSLYLGRALLTSCLVLGAPVLEGAAARLPFRSGFETGNFSEWDGGLDATMSVVSDVSSVGGYSAQSRAVPGTPTDNYKDYVFGDNRLVGGVAVSRENGLWLEFDTRFDTGYRFAACACVHKIAILNFENEVGRRRYQLILNVWSPDQTFFVEHLKWREDGGFDRAFPNLAQNRGAAAPLRMGQWDRIKMHIRPNTRGAADGELRMWINGVLKVEYTNIPMREDTNYMPNKLIMSAYVPNTDVSGTQRWDNFYLGEVDGSASGSTPRAPTLQSVE